MVYDIERVSHAEKIAGRYRIWIKWKGFNIQRACCMSQMDIHYYKKLKSNRGRRALAARGSECVAPATMADPTNGKEACLGTLCEV